MINLIEKGPTFSTVEKSLYELLKKSVKIYGECDDVIGDPSYQKRDNIFFVTREDIRNK